MTIEISYRFSELDKEHHFFIRTKPTDQTNIYAWETQYINWIWYYMGKANVKTKSVRIYPFSDHNKSKIKSYKFCNDAQRQARLLVEFINRNLKK